MAERKRNNTTNYHQNSNRTGANRTNTTRTSANHTKGSASHKKQQKPVKKSNSPLGKFLSKHTAKICIGLTAFIAVVLIAMIVMVAMTLSYDKVYDGIYLNGESISYMSKDELHRYIEDKYSKPISNTTIHVTSGEKEWELNASDLHITFNIDAIVDSIYNRGHAGSVVQRLGEIYNMRTNELHINIFEGSENEEPLVSYDQSIIDTLAVQIAQEAPSLPTQHQVQITDSEVSIVAGTNGYTYDTESVKNALLLAVNEFKNTELDIRTVGTPTLPDAIDIDATLQQVNKAPVDAAYKKVTPKEIEVSPEEYGFSVERTDLEAVVAQLEGNPGKSFTVPVTKINPSVYAADIAMPTYPDVLGEAFTNFGTSSSYRNRNTNLRVATEFLDGYILLPGEQFSFNSYVGDTTLDKGYKLAAGYANGKVSDTPGGGICQVSTTLYNAVINSVNVDVNERSNHSYTVSYVPKGLDCMINYNTNDFKFTNNTKYPIKIEGVFNSSGKLTYRILGVNENKDISYKFISTQTSSTAPTVKYTTNASEVQNGSYGGRWSVERVTYQSGIEIKREAFSKSTYKAMDKVVLKPTPTPSTSTTPAPTTPSAPVATTAPAEQAPVATESSSVTNGGAP